MNNDARKKVKKKYNSWKRYIDTKQNSDYVEHSRVRDQCSKKGKRRLRSEGSNRKTLVFWCFVQYGRKAGSAMSELDLGDGTTANTDQEKVDELNTFSPVCSQRKIL